MMAALCCSVIAVTGCAAARVVNDKITDFANELEQSEFNRSVNQKLGQWGESFDRKFGTMFGKEERAELKAEINATLDVESDRASTKQWQNKSSGASATIETSAVQMRQTVASTRKTRGLVVSPSMTTERTLVRMIGRTNIRSGPGTGHEVVKTVDALTVLLAVGRSPGGWYLLEQNGVAFGYVKADLTRPAAQADTAVASNSGSIGNAASAESTGVAQGSLAEGESVIDLDSVAVESATIVTDRECRTVKVSARGQTGAGDETRDFEVCKDAEGVWQL